MNVFRTGRRGEYEINTIAHVLCNLSFWFCTKKKRTARVSMLKASRTEGGMKKLGLFWIVEPNAWYPGVSVIAIKPNGPLVWWCCVSYSSVVPRDFGCRCFLYLRLIVWGHGYIIIIKMKVVESPIYSFVGQKTIRYVFLGFSSVVYPMNTLICRPKYSTWEDRQLNLHIFYLIS